VAQNFDVRKEKRKSTMPRQRYNNSHYRGTELEEEQCFVEYQATKERTTSYRKYAPITNNVSSPIVANANINAKISNAKAKKKKIKNNSNDKNKNTNNKVANNGKKHGMKCSNSKKSKSRTVLDSKLMIEESQLLMSLGLGSAYCGHDHSPENDQDHGNNANNNPSPSSRRNSSSSPPKGIRLNNTNANNNDVEQEEEDARDEKNVRCNDDHDPLSSCHNYRNNTSVVRFVNPEITHKWFCPQITDPQILSSLFYSEAELNEFRQETCSAKSKYEPKTNNMRKQFTCIDAATKYNNNNDDNNYHDEDYSFDGHDDDHDNDDYDDDDDDSFFGITRGGHNAHNSSSNNNNLYNCSYNKQHHSNKKSTSSKTNNNNSSSKKCNTSPSYFFKCT